MIEWFKEWSHNFLHDPLFFRRSVKGVVSGFALGSVGFAATIATTHPRLAIGIGIAGGVATLLGHMVPTGEKNQSIDQIQQGLVDKGAIPPVGDGK